MYIDSVINDYLEKNLDTSDFMIMANDYKNQLEIESLKDEIGTFGNVSPSEINDLPF